LFSSCAGNCILLMIICALSTICTVHHKPWNSENKHQTFFYRKMLTSQQLLSWKDYNITVYFLAQLDPVSIIWTVSCTSSSSSWVTVLVRTGVEPGLYLYFGSLW